MNKEILVISGIGILTYLLLNKSDSMQIPFLNGSESGGSYLGGDGSGSNNESQPINYNFSLGSSDVFGGGVTNETPTPNVTSKKSVSNPASVVSNINKSRGLPTTGIGSVGYQTKDGIVSYVQSTPSGAKVIGGENTKTNQSLGSSQAVRQAEASNVLRGITKKEVK